MFQPVFKDFTGHDDNRDIRHIGFYLYKTIGQSSQIPGQAFDYSKKIKGLCYDDYTGSLGGILKVQEARQLGEQLAYLVSSGQLDEAITLIKPVLLSRTPFRMLDVAGAKIGLQNPDAVNPFLDRIAELKMMGGWVVIASVLRQRLSSDLPSAFERCRSYVLAANTWYASDSFSERVPGPGLVDFFDPSMNILETWREDPNAWVRRMVGVSVHYWAKRVHGSVQFGPQVEDLLELLAPLFSERDADAIKGIGWGLKTLGKYYPEKVSAWLQDQVSRPYRALMLRKAMKKLPPELRKEIFEILS